MNLFDHHTHNLNAPAGQAVISLPRSIIEHPDTFCPTPHALYSVGVHPWWIETDAQEDTSIPQAPFSEKVLPHAIQQMWQGVERLSRHPQVVALGETGFDRLRGDLPLQEMLFEKHALLAAELGKDLIIHLVRAQDRLLYWRKRIPISPTSQWCVHGFRGKPSMAKQLTEAGIRLYFGPEANPETLALFPRETLRFETDDSMLSIEDVAGKAYNTLDNLIKHS